MLNAFILTAVTLPIFLGSKDGFTKKPFRFWSKGTGVNSLRLLDFTTATGAFFWADEDTIYSFSGISASATGVFCRVLYLLR